MSQHKPIDIFHFYTFLRSCLSIPCLLLFLFLPFGNDYLYVNAPVPLSCSILVSDTLDSGHTGCKRKYPHKYTFWFQVSEEYKLVPDTLYLTVHLVDLFLSEYYIERKRLQLLGITCMLIAS